MGIQNLFFHDRFLDRGNSLGSFTLTFWGSTPQKGLLTVDLKVVRADKILSGYSLNEIGLSRALFQSVRAVSCVYARVRSTHYKRWAFYPPRRLKSQHNFFTIINV